MKLLTQFYELQQATELNTALRDAGIMTFMSSVNSHMLSSTRTGAMRVGIWVVLDEQFNDAITLLSNPEHIPKKRLSFEEMEALEEEAYAQQEASNQKRIESIAAWVIGSALIGLLGYVVYSVVRSA